MIWEKKISPKKSDIEKIIDIKILKFIKYNKKVVQKKDKEVPDQVLFGLILGKISGPPKNLPKI